jgi:hypothetical protein
MFSKRWLTFNGLHGVISQKIVLLLKVCRLVFFKTLPQLLLIFIRRLFPHTISSSTSRMSAWPPDWYY